jgi:hypothetical protein
VLNIKNFLKLDALTLILITASGIATLPVWLPTYPVMADLPQHAAQVALLRSIHDPNFKFADDFQINWFTPYLFGYMLVYVLTPLLGIVAACKTVISVSLAALPLSTALVMHETNTDRFWALLTIPAMYGFSYYWGFLNFLVAAPVGMVFLWLTIRHARTASRMSSLRLALLVNVLFFSHALICAFFGLIAVFYLLFGSRTWRQAIVSISPLATVFPIAVLWIKHSSPRVMVPNSWNLGWFNTTDPYYSLLAAWVDHSHPGWGRISGFVPRLLGVEPNPCYLLVAGALFAIPLLAGARLSRQFTSWIPLGVCIAVLLFAPHTLYGTAFIYHRFTVFALPFFLIALEQTESTAVLPQAKWLRAVVPVILAAWISALCVRTMACQAAAAGFTDVLARMEPYERVVSLDFVRDNPASIAPPFAHYASWYGAEKKGLVDPNSAYWPVELMWFKPGKTPRVVFDFEWRPGIFDWVQFRGQDYRYFVASSTTDAGPYLFRNAPCTIHLRYHSGLWWLYERDPDCLGRAKKGEHETSNNGE